MSFLYIEEGDDEVKIRQEAYRLPSVNDLNNCDKIPGGQKPFFKKALKYIYHQYYNEHPLFKNLSYKERRQRVLELIFNNHEDAFKDLERNKRVVAVVKDYLESIRLFSEKKYMYILDKIEELSTHIEGIPLKIKKKVEKTIAVKFPDSNGDMVERDVPIKTEIEIDNSKEYYAALEMVSSIMDLEDKIRNKMKREKADRDLNPKSMVDNGEFDIKKS